MHVETIHLDNLTIGYRSGSIDKPVMSGIDACLSGGELTCLIGPNGIGKSTLLRTLSGFQPRLSGNFSIMNKDIDGYSAKDLAKLISVVLTEKNDIFNMTVEEIVGLGRTPYTGFWGKLDESDKLKVNLALSLVHIGHLAGRNVQTLSDGERQKMMIAKALAQDTPIIFLDEPTAFLDFPSKVDMLQLLHKLSRQTGKTIFLSTHDLELALQITDRLWIMAYDGLHTGTPESLSANGTINRFFTGDGLVYDKEKRLFHISSPAE